MAEGTINNYKIMPVVTTVFLGSGNTINAKSGSVLSNFTDYTVSVPSGYKILAHTFCFLIGHAGIFAYFDTPTLTSGTKPPIYVYNTFDSAVTTTAHSRVIILTLCEPL